MLTICLVLSKILHRLRPMVTAAQTELKLEMHSEQS